VTAPATAAKKSPAPGARKKTSTPAGRKKAAASSEGPGETKASPKKKRTVKRVPPFVDAELEDEEEVYACEIGPSDGGGGVIALVMILLTAGAGIAPTFMADASNTVKMAIPGGVGVVLAIIALVVLKGSGPKSLVLTNKRVFAKAGKWFAQSDVD
jgi:hypothetical protein